MSRDRKTFAGNTIWKFVIPPAYYDSIVRNTDPQAGSNLLGGTARERRAGSVLRFTRVSTHMMLAAVEERADERQLQRFSAACRRRIGSHLTDERSRRAVVVADLDADDGRRFASASNRPDG
jgi:hypothetical protein